MIKGLQESMSAADLLCFIVFPSSSGGYTARMQMLRLMTACAQIPLPACTDFLFSGFSSSLGIQTDAPTLSAMIGPPLDQELGDRHGDDDTANDEMIQHVHIRRKTALTLQLQC